MAPRRLALATFALAFGAGCTGGARRVTAQPLPPRPASPPAPAAEPVADFDVDDAIRRLVARRLDVPVLGVPRAKLVDTWSASRSGGRLHRAIDILAPAGTPVVAVEDGRIAKLFTSAAGGLTLYHFDPAGEFAYYHAHLEGYEPGVVEGSSVRRGQTIARVGSTGNARPEAPHLHFEILRLGPQRQWWKGFPINPYPVLTLAPPPPPPPTR